MVSDANLDGGLKCCEVVKLWFWRIGVLVEPEGVYSEGFSQIFSRNTFWIDSMSSRSLSP